MALPASGWQPAEDGVAEVCAFLRQYQVRTSDQNQIVQQLQRWSAHPDFNNYLTFIFCKAENQPVEVRQAAGLLLKTNIKSSYKNAAPAYQLYMKTALLPTLVSPVRELRKTAGTVISVMVAETGPQGWPEIFPAFAQCLESQDYNHMEGALDALLKICEDAPEKLDLDIPGLPDRPINGLLPLLLQCLSSPHAVLRRLALSTINQFILVMPSALFTHMDQYLQGLFSLATDSAGEVRRLVCSALVKLLEVNRHFLEPHIRNVIEYMLHAAADSDSEVALEAAEFWSACCAAELPRELLLEYLPRITPVLLRSMAYADDDEALLDAEEDENAPDRDEDVKPFLLKSRVAGGVEGALVDGDEDDDDEAVSAWNLRKCSAAGLDELSMFFKDELLPILMPLVEVRLSDTSAAWQEREAAVLALGAVAEGCIQGLLPLLPQIVTFLLPLLADKRPLVRSISCWTLSRYSKWLVKQARKSEDGRAQLDRVMGALLERILDGNKRVQEAACSAFATLEEEAGEELAPRLEPILQHLMFALGRYQRRNLRILYDAIGTLAEAVAGELAEPRYINILMPPLISKWQQLADSDRDLFPLLECLTSIASALGPAFTEYAEPVFIRCINLIRAQLQAKASGGHGYDKDFVVVALDLLSGLAEGLGPTIESLVSRSDLRDLLLQCCTDEDADVQQSALALVGDLARNCLSHLQPRVGDFVAVAAKVLTHESVLTSPKHLSVANNASWALGEIGVRSRPEVVPVVLPVLRSLVGLISALMADAALSINIPASVRRSLLENSAITLGRLACNCADLMGPHLEHFITPWCAALRNIRDDVEKEDAFRGLCAMVRKNPGAAVAAWVPLCQAVASWHEIRSPELRTDIGQVLHGLKDLLVSQQTWETYLAALEEPLRQKLITKYAL